MPWQNVRKWLEDEIETKDKIDTSNSLAEKLRAQISPDDFSEGDQEPKASTGDSGTEIEDKKGETTTSAEQVPDTPGKPDLGAQAAFSETQDIKKPEKTQEGKKEMNTSPTITESIPYGIEEATELMRGLPEDHIELVALVVKRTLESTNVKVSTIIDDASQKQKRIDDRISLLKNEIGKFEEEIALRRGEISTLETEGEEITTVKERLKLAEQLSIKENADKAPAAGGATDENPTPKPKKPPTTKK
ncbi:MAG: hypothetical protein DSZ32_01880 [Gammaproteobacteria bacterium]|nr:MAG: hypothetical protein DSZ33_03910 [Gammaproteobacteria bacterium]RTZ61493.1 MAG: hypothetical protein DSZ32_01880 [Gammaproteobacteria bacterium]